MTERPSERTRELAEWIEELVPHGAGPRARDVGSRPLDLEELEKELERSIDRRASTRRRRAA